MGRIRSGNLNTTRSFRSGATRSISGLSTVVGRLISYLGLNLVSTSVEPNLYKDGDVPWFESEGFTPGPLWKPWTPTLSAMVGSLTSSAVDEAIYTILGDMVFFHIRCYDVAGDNAANTGFRFTLPIQVDAYNTSMTGSQTHAFSGHIVDITGAGSVVAAVGVMSALDRAYVRRYDAAALAAAHDYEWAVNGFYRRSQVS